MCVIMLANETIFDSQNKVRVKSIAKVKPTDFIEVVKDIQRIFRKNPEYWDLHVEKLNSLAEAHKSLGAVEKAQKIMDAAGIDRTAATLANMKVDYDIIGLSYYPLSLQYFSTSEIFFSILFFSF